MQGFPYSYICILYYCTHIQWLPEQMECGNPQIGKSAVALRIPTTQRMIDTSFESPKCKL